MLTVSEKTWPEHLKAGIAAINEAMVKQDKKKYKKGEIIIGIRQAIMAEFSGIRTGDKIFFYMRGSKDILGLYEATTEPFFDKKLLFKGSKEINEEFPFRVGFKQIINFKNNINQEDIWEARDKGKIWTRQQSRGDAIGKHACVVLTKEEGVYIVHLFRERNLNEDFKLIKVPKPPKKRRELPIDLRMDEIKKEKVICIHYEDAFKTLLIKELCEGKHKDIFGGFDDVLQNVPTSSGKEIDILLIKYDRFGIVRYIILELKAGKFFLNKKNQENMRQLVDYGDWLIKVRENANTNNVHLFAVASCFEQKITDYVKLKKENDEKGIKLIKYQFNQKKNQITLQDVSP